MERRTFLAGAAIGLNRFAVGANERVTLALVGGRNRGSQIAEGAIKAGAHIKTFCDLDDGILCKVGGDITKWQGRPPEYVKEFQRVLDDKPSTRS